MLEELKYWIWLSLLYQVTPRMRYELVARLGDAQNLWEASEEELKQFEFLNPSALRQLTDRERRNSLRPCLKKLHESGICVTTIHHPVYPGYLKNIYDPPVTLFYMGKLKPKDNCIAIVGSRKSTSYGERMAEKISAQLSECGITIISGLARGIDSYAHKGALKAGGRTVAVLGCGVDTVYPIENRKLIEEILGAGAVISEYPPGVPPISRNFPARNRIISGMSLGVVVVEANEKSGSLITANFALEQGREVFALPGNIDSMNSSGTNKLIKDGAKMVTCVEDILEELKFFNCVNNNTGNAYKNNKKGLVLNGLDTEEKAVVRQLAVEMLHVDLLTKRSGLAVQKINALLVMLELKGVVEQLPGKIYRLR